MTGRQFSIYQNGTTKSVDIVGRNVTGYFSCFGNVDSDGDVIQKGAFARTLNDPLQRERIKHLLQHDTTRPLGNPSVLQEDEIGLYFSTQFANTQDCNDTLAFYENGTYNEHSIGFEIIQSKTDESNLYGGFSPAWNPTATQPVRIITEVKLWEGSTVTWGANQNTPFMGMKSNTSIDDVLKHIVAQKNLIIKNQNIHFSEKDLNYEQLAKELQVLKALTSLHPKQFTAPVENEIEKMLDELKKLSNTFKI